MAKPELGTKRVCVACGARFYDLGKTPAICPKCHAEQPVEQPRPHRPSGPIAEEARSKVAKVETEAAEADVEEEGAEGSDEEVIEDTSDLEDDSSTIGADIAVPSNEEHES